MSQERIESALNQITGPATDVVKVYRESFGDQVDFLQFRRWLQAVCEMPDDVRLGIVDCVGMTPEEAFHKCCPGHVSLEEFLQLANAQPKQDKPSTTTRKKKAAK